MKTIIKNNIKIIIAFVLGVFISGIGATALTLSFASGDVEHTKSDGTKINVKAAINDLYSKATSGDATSDQLLSGKKALSKGTLLTGTMSNYSSSTAQSCTTANTSNKLYVKPSNAGYYTANSSFNTNINYNPNKTVAASTSTAAATANGNTTATTINLDKDRKVTIPAGYYSAATTVQNVAKGGSIAEAISGNITLVANNGGSMTGDPTWNHTGTETITLTVKGSGTIKAVSVTTTGEGEDADDCKTDGGGWTIRNNTKNTQISASYYYPTTTGLTQTLAYSDGDSITVTVWAFQHNGGSSTTFKFAIV